MPLWMIWNVIDPYLIPAITCYFEKHASSPLLFLPHLHPPKILSRYQLHQEEVIRWQWAGEPHRWCFLPWTLACCQLLPVQCVAQRHGCRYPPPQLFFTLLSDPHPTTTTTATKSKLMPSSDFVSMSHSLPQSPAFILVMYTPQNVTLSHHLP